MSGINIVINAFRQLVVRFVNHLQPLVKRSASKTAVFFFHRCFFGNLVTDFHFKTAIFQD